MWRENPTTTEVWLFSAGHMIWGHIYSLGLGWCLRGIIDPRVAHWNSFHATSKLLRGGEDDLTLEPLGSAPQPWEKLRELKSLEVSWGWQHPRLLELATRLLQMLSLEL